MGANGALLAMTAISAASTAYSSSQQSKAQKAQGEYESGVYETNARLAEIQAADAIRRGDINSKERKKETKKLIGAQRAALAAQGQDLSLEGSDALEIQQETAELGALDALEIKNNAWREAWGFRVQANDYRNKGAFASITAKNKSKNTLLTGGLTIAKDLAGSYYKYKTVK